MRHEVARLEVLDVSLGYIRSSQQLQVLADGSPMGRAVFIPILRYEVPKRIRGRPRQPVNRLTVIL